jgi:ribonuclease P protein 3
MASRQQLPKTFLFFEWFKKNQNDKVKINQMLEYISEHGILIPEVDANEFSNALKNDYNCSLVTINRKGKCPSCAGQLPGVKLMDSEFKKIATTFLNDIIIKSDVFVKSNPQEVERFKNFVEKTMPYDCVIDGLNVAFSQGNKLSNAIYSKILAQVVKHFVEQNQKILVIGRKYMEGWPRKEMQYIKANSKLFLVEDL